MKVLEKWFLDFLKFNTLWAPYLIAANVVLGILALLVGFWISGLFNLSAAYTMYFVFYRLNK